MSRSHDVMKKTGTIFTDRPGENRKCNTTNKTKTNTYIKNGYKNAKL